jgi:hypothetical protein
MRRIIVMAGALAALAVPAVAGAQSGDQPTSTDKQNAAQECRFERGTTDATREAFRIKYGTNKNGRNAFGKCVSKHARDEHSEGKSAASNAAKDCKAERGDTADSKAAFTAKYGTSKNGNNAFGKCVSQKAKAQQDAADAQDKAAAQTRKNAAKTCDEERGDTAESRAAFKAKWGTNKNKSNAFGKCVSATAKAQQDTQEQPTQEQGS